MRILGISTEHDSSVSIINDGQLEYFCKEERLTKDKRDSKPWVVLMDALKNAKGVIDKVTISSPTLDDPWLEYLKSFLGKMLDVEIIDYSDRHHLCHASLAFYNSGFKEALCLVIDRDGSIVNNFMREAESVFKVSYKNGFKILHKNYWVFNNGVDFEGKKVEIINSLSKKGFKFNIDSSLSITKIYESATTLIGQNALENGKTMGLSSYGKSSNSLKLFKDSRPLDHLFTHSNFINNINSPLLTNHLNKINRNINQDNYKFYANYAYKVQQQTQLEVLNLIKTYIQKTKITNICISGGYGLNVISNYFLKKSLPNINFYMEPLADDSGNSIGSSYHLYRKISKDSTIYKKENDFLGKKYSLNQIEKEITKYLEK